MAYGKERQFRGSLVVQPTAITFDARTSPGINKMIGVLYPPGELDRVVQTARGVLLLRLSAVPATKWLVLDDFSVPVGKKRVLVALQWPRRRKVLYAVDLAGFSIRELRIPKGEFQRFLTGEATA
jgi:hypothetical protein